MVVIRKYYPKDFTTEKPKKVQNSFPAKKTVYFHLIIIQL